MIRSREVSQIAEAPPARFEPRGSASGLFTIKGQIRTTLFIIPLLVGIFATDAQSAKPGAKAAAKPVKTKALGKAEEKAQSKGPTCAALANPKKRTDLLCMTCACYHESRGEPTRGKESVLKVILTRKASDLYPDTVCGVVTQRKQFSWWPTKAGVAMSDEEPLSVCQEMSKTMLHQERTKLRDYSSRNFYGLHFHSTSSAPDWSKGCRSIETIGDHVFYRDCSQTIRANSKGKKSPANGKGRK